MDKNKNVPKEESQKSRYPITFLILILSSTLIAIFVAIVISFILKHFHLIRFGEQGISPLWFLLLLAILIDVFTTIPFLIFAAKPILKVINASKKIAKGDYSVRIPLGSIDAVEELTINFNKMAAELESVEMLQSDFINNFSHEFKTPIVSIRGFAKMLKRSDLTDEERAEYLDIIIAESERLAELSTNVLNLSKIEQQTILTDTITFNASEQIRLVIAMLDTKWADKQISITFDASELFITGNENMLQEVWLNLLDNAIKFSDKYGKIDVTASTNEKNVIFTFTNYGVAISAEDMAHIFDKFYQGDKSHSEKGNGLGLAIADRIVKLHNGTIHLETSSEERTTFVVTLPAASHGASPPTP
ncbi:MAG: HAMP domain-containing histidine kinase [Lachnospiraceae bacterium]|nr:HAMP domain-containing histidine kinase [Lachnospiraceae bacterium]